MSVASDVVRARAFSARARVVSGAAAVAVLAGGGGWFAFASPHESRVSVSIDAASAAPGAEIPVSGLVTPAAPNRVVQLSVAGSANGPFEPAATAVTDAAGRFEGTWSPKEPGQVWLRAQAAELGRDQAASSTAAAVTVRTPAAVTLKVPAKTMRTTSSLELAATVRPSGGAVTFEVSSDGESWSALAGGKKPGVATVSQLKAGTWQLRAQSAQTDTAGSATSKAVTLVVEDYKAAGERYLAIVARGNKQVQKLNALIDSGASNSAVRKQAATLSRAYTQQAEDFRAYKAWPREVAPVIDQLIKACVLDADDFHMRSQTRTIDEWNAQADSVANARENGSVAAARARDLLGLPKRDLHP